MASSKVAWGIEVGAYAIKAVKLERVDGGAKLVDFAVIPHRKVLTTPDLDQDEMIRLGLGQFVSQKSIVGDRAVISVPGSAAFARFAKLPPVEPRKVPDIVRFEAVQQIPFPIEEVEWDYQTFEAADSPEIEVGIFAITKERLDQRLALYGELGINPDYVTLSPLAVFNSLSYDMDLEASKKPLVFLDIGTSATDLIVADEGRCWIRTFPLGGTHFTEAIAESFKLSYGKADALKQESATSKYAKQIMQAMRPVFTDLLSDVQKSLNFYQQLHRGVSLETVVGLGSTFKIPGLRKFLGQQLNLDVLRLDEFRKIRVEGREAADFAANAVNMATAYGLALQGIGLSPISVNLAPVRALREQLWASKTKWFVAAAGLAVVAGGLLFTRGLLDQAALQSSSAAATQASVESVLAQGKRFKNEYQQISSTANVGFVAENLRRLVEDRRVWPALIDDVSSSVASAAPQAELLGEDADMILKVPAGDRRAVLLEDLRGTYGFSNGTRTIHVEMAVAFSHRDRQEFLDRTIATWLREHADVDRPGVPYRILGSSIKINADRLMTLAVGSDGKIPPFDPSAVLASRGSNSTNSYGAPSSSSGGGGVGFGAPASSGGGNESDSRGSSSIKGRRSVGDQISRPGSGLGFGGTSGGGGGSSESTTTDEGLGGDRPDSSRTIRRGTGGSSETGKPKFDLDALAPIPGAPPIFSAGDQFYRGVVTFDVELSPVRVAGSGEAPAE